MARGGRLGGRGEGGGGGGGAFLRMRVHTFTNDGCLSYLKGFTFL